MRPGITANKVIIRLLIGFVIGMIAGVAIPLITTGGRSVVSSKFVVMMGGSTVLAAALSIFLSGIFGVISFGGTLFYEIDSWNVAKATTLHLAVILVGYLSVGLLLDWFPLDVKWILIIVVMMTAVFFIIWLIMYIIGKNQIKKLNEIQNKYKNKTEESK